jgi:hypothetical protein
MVTSPRSLPAVVLVLGVVLLAWGCGAQGQVQAPVAADAKAAPVADPQKQALLPQMSHVARTATQGWDALTADQRAPFLQFHAGDEERARRHYETLVETEREIMQNVGR